MPLTVRPDIFIPPDNVFDTVDIYFVQARHRRLSLRFLSWFVLDEQIQAHARDGHDSIEDALAALRLWLAFQRFEAEGVWVRKLEEIYREGKQYVRACHLSAFAEGRPAQYLPHRTISRQWWKARPPILSRRRRWWPRRQSPRPCRNKRCRR
jgi:hypothetical protein